MQKAQLEVLLLWYGIPRKDHPKGNNGKAAKWLKLVEEDPPASE
jgi:hypothetical protein